MESMMSLQHSDLEEGSVKRAIIENAKKPISLADDSKKLGDILCQKWLRIKRAMIITNQCEPQRLKVFKEKRRL